MAHYQKTKDNQNVFQYTLEYNVYLLIYFGVCKNLPSNFSFGLKYRQDLEEFSNKVLCKYGVKSHPGIKALLELSTKGNIFALYECGDMYYYGNKKHPEPDYNKAIEYYRKAGGVDKKENIDETNCNPLALWSLSYIYFNYQRRLDLKEVKNIYELDRLTVVERVEYAVNYAKKAVELTECGPAYNILGLISQFVDKELCEKNNLKDPIYYFKKSAELDYIYAFVNIAMLEKDQIFTDEKNKFEHLKEYLYYLTIAGDKPENWADNELGLLYLNGIVSSDNTKKQYVFENLIDRKQSLNYFKRATEHIIDNSSIEAIANMVIHFPELYLDDNSLFQNHVKMVYEKNNRKAMEMLEKHFHETYGYGIDAIIK